MLGRSMTREKTNHVAAVDKPPIELSDGAVFVDGSQLSDAAGGIVADGDNYYSLARVDMVPTGRHTYHDNTGWQLPANRTGKISLLEHDASQPTTYGAEFEHVRMAQDGPYADHSEDYLLAVNELYTFMGEFGTEPTDDPAELERRYRSMIDKEIDAAEAAGYLVAALSVFGQYKPKPDQLSPSVYVANVAEAMLTRTGFDVVETFRTAGAQAHTGVSNTMAAIKAAEAMQYLSPILMSPTLSGPLLNEGLAENLKTTRLNGFQIAHLKKTGITVEDLSGPYQSWRYLLRRAGSPSAGIWQTPPPETKEEYLAVAHKKLADGDINSIDRLNGWHTDRLRVVLDGNGANTVEDCSTDTALGNLDTLLPLQILRSALTTKFEAMAIRGEDPRAKVARMLGTIGLSRQARLNLAHHLSLREVSRYGNDASTYRRRRPGDWLPELLHLADSSPYTRLSETQKTRLKDMYATWEETEPRLRRWCRENGEDSPTAQAYFDLGLNNPAVYMRARYDALRAAKPKATKEELIRQVELEAAVALHHSHSRAKELA